MFFIFSVEYFVLLSVTKAPLYLVGRIVWIGVILVVNDNPSSWGYSGGINILPAYMLQGVPENCLCLLLFCQAQSQPALLDWDQLYFWFPHPPGQVPKLTKTVNSYSNSYGSPFLCKKIGRKRFLEFLAQDERNKKHSKLTKIARKWDNTFIYFYFYPLSLILTFPRHWPQSIQEDPLTRRQEEGLTGRRNHRNLTTREADITKGQPYKKTGRSENEKLPHVSSQMDHFSPRNKRILFVQAYVASKYPRKFFIFFT